MGYWNHNVHYHPLVLRAVPVGCATALDVGCGDGLLVRQLARRIPAVTGVDSSEAMIRLAREQSAGLAAATFHTGDFLEPDGSGVLAPRSYDFISAVAVLHQVDLAPAVTALVRLLRPGGRLVVIGLARNGTPQDWIISAAGLPAARLHARRHGGKTDPDGMPIQEPTMTWSQVRQETARLLPTRRFTRHLLWRYSLVWDRPIAGEGGVSARGSSR